MFIVTIKQRSRLTRSVARLTHARLELLPPARLHLRADSPWRTDAFKKVVSGSSTVRTYLSLRGENFRQLLMDVLGRQS